MKGGNMIALGLLGIVLVLGAYIRLAPSDPAIWHKMPANLEVGDGVGSAARRVDDRGDTLAQLDEIIRKSPRTSVLAGSVEDGMITYITRTPLARFPAYTTVRQKAGSVELYGRLRFGRSDMGVNRKRLDGWLAQLQV